MSLSERIRPGVEAAPWVIHEIMELETALAIIQERHSASLEALKLAAQINPFGSVENAAARDAARAMMPTAHVPEMPAEPTPPTYSYSTDDEIYHGEFDSPDAAAAEAFYNDPELEAVSIGENRKHPAHRYVSADRILEDIETRLADARRRLVDVMERSDLEQFENAQPVSGEEWFDAIREAKGMLA